MRSVTCIIDSVGNSGIPITRTFVLDFLEFPVVGDEIQLNDGQYTVVRRVWNKGLSLTVYLVPVEICLKFSLRAQ